MIAKYYVLASFDAYGVSRINHLERRLEILQKENLELKERLDTLTKTLKMLTLFLGPGARKLVRERGVDKIFKKIEKELKEG